MKKKNLEPAAKGFFNTYLENMNPHCLLLLRAPSLTAKQLPPLSQHPNAHIIQTLALDETAMQTWIKQSLHAKAFSFEPQVPLLIYQYTQGNMLACDQVITKLALIAEPNSTLDLNTVQELLVNQSDLPLFALADACLANLPDKAILVLQQAHNTKVEPSLVLWSLTQEIRLLIQLIHLTTQAIPFNTACNQLKIWPYRHKLYQATLKKADLNLLLHLLECSKYVDAQIKSNQQAQAWQTLECIALSLCTAKRVGCFT